MKKTSDVKRPVGRPTKKQQAEYAMEVAFEDLRKQTTEQFMKASEDVLLVVNLRNWWKSWLKQSKASSTKK
jgi:hypothetical protein